MKLKTIVLLLACLGSLTANSQSQFHFSTLGMEQGLSSATAWSMCQDKYGFMWIGTTNGLNRYDGHTIRQYFYDAKDSFSLPGNTVYWIHKDNDGDLWFACGAKGLATYNYSKDRFEYFKPYDVARKKSGRASPVWRIGEDQLDRIYIACGAACYRYTKSTGTIEDITPLFKGQIDNAGVAMFVEQGKDKLWILTDNGLFLHTLSTNAMEQIPYDAEKYGNGRAAFIDAEFINDEEMILTTPKSCFVFFNTHTGKFRPPPKFLDPAFSKVFSMSGGIIKDKNGRIWIANSVYGLMEYLDNGEIALLKSQPSYPYPHLEQEGQGMHVYEDRDGNVWYGTSQRGVVWFNPKINFIEVYKRDYANPSSLAGENVFGFLQINRNETLIGTGNGLSRLDNTTKKMHNYPTSINSNDKNPASLVFSITGNGDTVYMATIMGLSIYFKKDGSFQRYVKKEDATSKQYTLFNNSLGLVYETTPGELILISTDGNAARFDLGTGKCFHKTNSGTADTLFGFTGISAAYQDKAQHCLWMEAGEGELYRYDYLSKTATRHSYTSDTTIKGIGAIQLDKAGSLWLATKSGLINYEPSTKKNKRVALSANSHDIYNVGYDKDGFIWATTVNEIVKLDPASGQSGAFNVNAMMPYSNLRRRSMYVDENNKIWIASNNGFCVVNSREFNPVANLNPPHLVNFRVFDKAKVFDQPYYDLKELELDHDENFFSFDFSALDFHQVSGLQYAYFLEDFDKAWHIVDKNSGSYTNVPPGKYKLLLRSQYGTDKWKEAPPVIIRIRAPWWQRWWAIGLMLLLVTVSCYFIYRSRQKRKKQKQIDKTIDYFANSLSGENSVNEICGDIARNCILQLHFQDCAVYLKDEKEDVLIQKAAYGSINPKGIDLANPVEVLPGKGIVGIAASSGKPVNVPDISKDNRFSLNGEKRGSKLAVPILHDNEVIGIIDCEHPKRNFFTPDYCKAVITIASISSNKIAESMAESKAVEKEFQLLEIKKLLAESRLMSLRAQMNPHFVFNCLNSIQECIVTNKYGEASNYLNKFSKLFRTVLNNSGKNFVTLNEEKQVLELYIALEHMRFEESFSYEIKVDKKLDLDELMIPSMLLQPYIENALWHGLMHKEGDRHLLLSFQYVSEEIFQCIIEDNGIGRKRSVELKAEGSKLKRHQSMGMQISKDRVELLQRQQQHAKLEIIDKVDASGNAVGTKVVVELATDLG